MGGEIPKITRKEEVISSVIASTYKCSAKGCQKDCSLRVQMMHPDPINEIHIENNPDGLKTEDIPMGRVCLWK